MTSINSQVESHMRDKWVATLQTFMFIVERFNCFDKDYCQTMWRIFIIFGHTAYIHFNRINLKRFLIKTRHIETFAREHSLSIQMIFAMLQNLNAKYTISTILYEWINNKHIKTDVFHCVSVKKTRLFAATDCNIELEVSLELSLEPCSEKPFFKKLLPMFHCTDDVKQTISLPRISFLFREKERRKKNVPMLWICQKCIFHAPFLLADVFILKRKTSILALRIDK